MNEQTYPDSEQVYSLALLGLETADIAALLQIEPEELVLHYQSELAQGMAGLRKDILTVQVRKAVKEENIPMLMHLGKTICNQNERQEVDVKHEAIMVQSYGAEDALTYDQRMGGRPTLEYSPRKENQLGINKDNPNISRGPAKAGKIFGARECADE